MQVDEYKLTFPPGSKVMLKKASMFHDEAYVIYRYEIRQMKNIRKYVMTEYNGKEIPKEIISQFFIKTDEVMIGSKVVYGNGGKPAKVIGLDKEKEYSTDKAYATIEFLSGDRKTVLYNSCRLPSPTLTPIDFGLYRELWTDYKLRDRMSDKSKLFYLMAPYYKIRTIGGIDFATDPKFLEEKEEKKGWSKQTTKDIQAQMEEDERAQVCDPPLEQAKVVYVENRKINLTFDVEELKKQLFAQGYKVTKL